MMPFDITVTIGGVDVSAWLPAGPTIDYGRGTPLEGFTAPQAVLDLFTIDSAPAPLDPADFPTIAISDPVLIHVTWNGTTQWRRFTGVVQAVDWSLYNLRVTCCGNSVDFDTRVAGDTQPTGGMPNGIPIPAELDMDRATRLATEAGLDLNIVGTEGRWVLGIPADEPGRPLLTVLLEMAEDCNAFVRETRLGDVDYVARIHTVPTAYTLPAAVVNAESIDLGIERGLLVNAVDVYYGPRSTTTGQQAHIYMDDSGLANTIATYGERRESLDSQLVFREAAEGRATQYLQDHSLNYYVPDVTLNMNLANGTQANAILTLSEGDPVSLTTLPAGCPIASYDATIIGFTEILHPTDYRITLHLSYLSEPSSEPSGNWCYEGDYTGGDDTGSYIDGDAVKWFWHAFTGDGTLTATSTARPVMAQLLLVAGGGGGGARGSEIWAGGADGGAGGLADEQVYLGPSDSWPITIGAGGAAGTLSPLVHATNGGDSEFDQIIVRGGGGGGNGYTSTNTICDGWDGGSGGGRGNGSETIGYALPGVACTSHGHDGSATGDQGATHGGGSVSSGSGTSTGTLSGITGTDERYACAGVGPDVAWPYGNGGLHEYLTGDPDATAGAPGICIIAYPVYYEPA